MRNIISLLRISKPITKILGKQFESSLNMLEIDITYQCNLKCYNCDRSCRQAPTTEHVSVGQIIDLLDETKSINKKWKRIRILGGEPTLHPDFEKIIEILIDYKIKYDSEVELELVSNGYGDYVKRKLNSVPEVIKINNTNKTGLFQQKFEPFNLAPVDERKYILTDFTNGCWITAYCGIGFGKNGFYPCGVGASIDRILGKNLGFQSIPQDRKELQSQMKELCKLCGHFTFRNFRPINTRIPVNGELKSRTWVQLYSEYNNSSK
ncbi:MAG: radical SAM protein [Candidatus Heimdallarchaeota archaeon]|nr:radical SAM protein [Candidatus Heimdallarchaeota archaeon]